MPHDIAPHAHVAWHLRGTWHSVRGGAVLACQWYKSSRTPPPFWTMVFIAGKPAASDCVGCFEFRFAKHRRIRQAECSSFASRNIDAFGKQNARVSLRETSTLAGSPTHRQAECLRVCVAHLALVTAGMPIPTPQSFAQANLVRRRTAFVGELCSQANCVRRRTVYLLDYALNMLLQTDVVTRSDSKVQADLVALVHT